MSVLGEEKFRMCYTTGFYNEGLFISASPLPSVEPGTKWMLVKCYQGTQPFKMTETIHLAYVLLPVVGADGVSAAGGPSPEPQGLALCRVTSRGLRRRAGRIGGPSVLLSVPSHLPSFPICCTLWPESPEANKESLSVQRGAKLGRRR